MTPALLCLLATLHAEPAAGPEHKGVVEVVLDHIADSRSIEFQMPWGPKFEYTLPEWKLQLGRHVLDLSLTKHVVFMWLSSLLMLLVISLAAKPRRDDEGPRGLAAAIEGMVLFVRDIAVQSIGEHDADRYTPYLCTIFFFILFCGLVGCIPLTATATGNIAVTAGLALCTFALTQIAGMRAHGVVGYWAHIVPAGVPWWLYPVMLPVEILGLFTKPFALTVRLFANMIANHMVILILLGLVFLIGAYVAPISVAFALGVYLLELLIIGIQAYIFTLLSASFIGMAAHGH